MFLSCNKSSAVAEMGDCGHNRHGPKRGGAAVPLSWGSWVPVYHNVASAEVYFRTMWRLHQSSHLATTDMGQKLGGGLRTKWHLDPYSHFATIDKDRKLGVCAPFLGEELVPYLAQCGLSGGLPPHQVASWCIQPFGHSRYGLKIGGVPLWGRGAGFPSNTMWPGLRPTCMPIFILIHPSTWPQYTNVTDRTDNGLIP